MPLSQTSFLDRVLGALKDQMRSEQFGTWFRGFSLGEVTDDEIEYRVPSGFVRDWLNRNYLEQILAATHSVLAGTNDRLRSVRITMDASLDAGGVDHVGHVLPNGVLPDGVLPGGVLPKGAPPSEVHPDGVMADAVLSDGLGGASEEIGTTSIGAVASPMPQADIQRLIAASKLNADYTFEQFVVGPSNQLSHAASLAVGQNPGRAYNPLFIHGNVGLGKTHLLQSITHSIRNRPNLSRVVYLSCEEFTNRYILALQTKRIEAFRDHYRTADALIIDDVQFLSGKDRTQEEFFHTFNALYNSKKQIVFSSDRSPADIQTIQERLVSRFKWGLVTDIQPPCFETRLAIVKRKASMREVDLADDVAQFIAERITANIREVEGAVLKVIGVAAITDREITLSLAEDALQGVATRSNQLAIPDVISLITSEFSVSARDLTGKSRTQKVSLPRQIGMFLSREFTDHSLEEVGRYFGNRDHTTVLYAVTKIKKRAKSDRMFRELLAKLSNRLETGTFERRS